MKQRILIGSLWEVRILQFGPLRWTGHEAAHIGCQTVPIFGFHFLQKKKNKNARNAFYLVMSEFQYKFCFPEPITEAGEEGRLKE